MNSTVLSKLLEEVSTKVPYYSSYKNAEIHDYPLMSKKTIKSNYEKFLSNDLNDRQAVLTALLNPMEINNYIIEKSLSSDLLMEWTTGSSGIPFKCVKRKHERSIMSLNIWKRRMRVDRSLVPSKFFPFIHTGTTGIPFDIRDYSSENLNALYAYVKNNDYTCIHTTPTLLKRHVLESNIEQSIFLNNVRFIESTGSFLKEEEKKLYENVFNATILNSYGLIELWTIGYTCRNGHMHIIDDNIYFELIDNNGSVILEENKIGQVVVTSLHQHTMPFVRYLTGDYAEYTGQQCSCGDTGPIIRLNESRLINYLTLNGTRIDGNKFVKKMLRYVFWLHEFNEINYMCMIQNDYNFTLYLNRFEDHKRFEDLVSEPLMKELGNEITIAFKYITLEEYEEINFKNHLFINRSEVATEKIG